MVYIYDTTLRDGAQTRGVSFSLEDKLRITRALDDLGVHYIEGGWPGSNPKDLAYFEAVKKLADEGDLKPHICKTFKLEEAKEAIQFLTERKVVGKIAVVME